MRSPQSIVLTCRGEAAADLVSSMLLLVVLQLRLLVWASIVIKRSDCTTGTSDFLAVLQAFVCNIPRFGNRYSVPQPKVEGLAA